MRPHPSNPSPKIAGNSLPIFVDQLRNVPPTSLLAIAVTTFIHLRNSHACYRRICCFPLRVVFVF
jgi:hypothetical protein